MIITPTPTSLSAIKDAIGIKPYYVDGPDDNPIGLLYNADCLDILPKIPDKSIDLVLTDPPYGVNFNNEKWDSHIPDWFNGVQKMSDNIIFTTAPCTQWDYPRPDWVSCWYRPASSSRSISGGFNHWTPILIYGKSKFMVDTINLHAIQYAYEKGFPHPSPKPLELMLWILSNVPSDLILDPFLGSGTTAVAAKQLGRRYVGIEISQKYCDIAVERLRQGVMNL